MANTIDLIEVNGAFQPVGENYHQFCNSIKVWAKAKGIPIDSIDMVKIYNDSRNNPWREKSKSLGVEFLTVKGLE